MRYFKRRIQGLVGQTEEQDENLAKVLHHLLKQGHCIKIVVNIFADGAYIEETINNFGLLLTALNKNNLKISPSNHLTNCLVPKPSWYPKLGMEIRRISQPISSQEASIGWHDHGIPNHCQRPKILVRPPQDIHRLHTQPHSTPWPFWCYCRRQRQQGHYNLDSRTSKPLQQSPTKHQEYDKPLPTNFRRSTYHHLRRSQSTPSSRHGTTKSPDQKIRIVRYYFIKLKNHHLKRWIGSNSPRQSNWGILWIHQTIHQTSHNMPRQQSSGWRSQEAIKRSVQSFTPHTNFLQQPWQDQSWYSAHLGKIWPQRRRGFSIKNSLRLQFRTLTNLQQCHVVVVAFRKGELSDSHVPLIVET